MDLADERGGVRHDGFRGIAVALAVVTLLLFELGAIVTNVYQLDDLSGRAAVVAAAAWQHSQQGPRVLRAVEQVVDGTATIRSIDVSTAERTVKVSLQRGPQLLVLDRVPLLREKLALTVTRQAALDPQGL